jgi:hypothetical protein
MAQRVGVPSAGILMRIGDTGPRDGRDLQTYLRSSSIPTGAAKADSSAFAMLGVRNDKGWGR